MTAIGFIGLGLMGNAMVCRLLDKGYDLTVLANRSRTNVEAAVARGAKEASSPKALAEASDVIMLCVDTSESVEARMRGNDGIIAGLKPGAVVIDFGTSLPASTRALAQEVAGAGSAYLDAPLGRTPQHAYDGLLNIMCAGDKTAFDKVEPVLKDLGENVFHLGESGAGHTIKLLNNFFGMTVANAMAEVMAISDHAGVDRKQAHEVIAAGPLHSMMVDFVAAYGVDGDSSKLAFSIQNAAKDLGYYRQMARDTGVESVMAVPAAEVLADASKTMGDRMVSEMVDYYANRFGG